MHFDTRYRVLIATLAASTLWVMRAAAALAPAEFAVTTNVLKHALAVPPLGANAWGRCGAIEWAANNFVVNAGNEPIVWRNLHRVMTCGTNWFEIDGPGTSWYDLWNSGFLSGADLRFYRIVDADGKPLPLNSAGNNLDLAKAHHVVLLGTGRIVPDGAPGFPDGGWLASKYAALYPLDNLHAEVRAATDRSGADNGRTYWYTVVAIGPNGQVESEPSNEVSATPTAGLTTVAVSNVTRRLQARGADKDKPAPPRDLTAVAGDGFVVLSWKPSPSAGVVGYRVKRSTLPAAQQVNRVYVEHGAPQFQRFDYVVLEKRFDSFSMRAVNPRVRGMGNPGDQLNWPWRGDMTKLTFAQVPHPAPLPAEMLEPGETCLRVTAAPGTHKIEQLVFIGTQAEPKEARWYGQLEPGKSYRLEVWLRQEGLGNGGSVRFDYGVGYPDIHQEFPVTNIWRKYSYSFTAPARPTTAGHFGHTFRFTGPGTLWMDNCRVYRVDAPADAAKPYVPNATVFDELLANQPARGPKGAHRTWYLDRDATMRSILGWHANSKVNVDWSTSVGETMAMTLPMGLLFDLQTGSDPQSRMRPWLVLQHILHSEQDWLNFIEYLAAPYDPAKDSPATKPWAYKRFQQRGVGTPWVDEFPEIILEFGNETWHNGIFADWLGFAVRNAVHQGGFEYGLFTRYLVEVMQKSPYWQSCQLDKKLRFCLGGNYDCRTGRDGAVHGYGEDALQANPYATTIGHANYVGPKWETGDYADRAYDDRGVLECALSYLTGVLPGQTNMSQGQAALRARGRLYDIVAYEGGPGGYALPGHAVGDRGATIAQEEINEQYGKSLAQAVGALDCWLDSYRLGWTYQCFLGYGQGTHWNSHTVFADGFRPHVAWLAMTLRNRHAAGDLMQVEQHAVPSFTRGAHAYPLVGVYALRDGTRWSVFVLSRAVNTGVLGDGVVPVTLRLPFANARSCAVYRLAGDPRATNREKMNVAITRTPLDAGAVVNGTLTINAATGGVKDGLPPGSILLYVLDACTD